jgi:hypothetical protein
VWSRRMDRRRPLAQVGLARRRWVAPRILAVVGSRQPSYRRKNSGVVEPVVVLGKTKETMRSATRSQDSTELIGKEDALRFPRFFKNFHVAPW